MKVYSCDECQMLQAEGWELVEVGIEDVPESERTREGKDTRDKGQKQRAYFEMKLKKI